MKRVDTEKFKVSIVNATLDCSSFEVGENAVVMADFAYELEREVDRLRRLLAKANDEVEAERKRIIAVYLVITIQHLNGSW